MPRPGARQFQRSLVESRAAAALHGRRIGGESTVMIDTDLDGGNSLFSQTYRRGRIEVSRIREPSTRAPRNPRDHVSRYDRRRWRSIRLDSWLSGLRRHLVAWN